MISIIIPSYKRSTILLGSLLDLRHQNLFLEKPIEVLIGLEADDPQLEEYHSLIDQVASVFDAKFDNTVKVIPIEGSFHGLVNAKIRCVKQSKYPYLFFMDDDLFFTRDYLEKLVDDLQSNGDAAASSGFIVSSLPAISHTQPSDDVSTVPTETRLQTLNLDARNKSWHLAFGNKEQVMNWNSINRQLPKDKRYLMDYFVNSFLCIKDDYIRVGGFNPKLNSKTSAHEEVDLTYRLQKGNKKLIFNPFVQGWHITIGAGGIYKGSNYKESQAILQKEYQESFTTFIDSVTA